MGPLQELLDNACPFVSLFLVGDVDGDHTVDRGDLYAIRSAYGARAGSIRYFASADANMDGRITAIDLSLARMNEVYGRSSWYKARVPAALADKSTDAGGVYDRIAAVTPKEGFEPNAAMQFFESEGGWVQPLASKSGPEGGVWTAPGHAGMKAVVIVDWFFCEACYGNDVSLYTVDVTTTGRSARFRRTTPAMRPPRPVGCRERWTRWTAPTTTTRCRPPRRCR